MGVPVQCVLITVFLFRSIHINSHQSRSLVFHWLITPPVFSSSIFQISFYSHLTLVCWLLNFYILSSRLEHKTQLLLHLKCQMYDKSSHCVLQQRYERNKTIRIITEYQWGFECVYIKLLNEDFIIDKFPIYFIYQYIKVMPHITSEA